MSIIDTFDDQSEAVVNPGHIAKPVENFPETLVVTFKAQITDIVKANYTPEEIQHLFASFRLPIYKFRYKGHPLGLYMTVVGGAATVALMEEALAMGAKRVLIFGACGVLDGRLTAGRFILPTAAYRDEGTSYHYMPASDFVDVPTAKRVGEIFGELDIPFVFGKTWTTDAFYRETRNNVERRKREGCIAVDMECASVMAAGRFRNVPVYQFLYAEDSLDGETWDARTMGSVPPSDNEKYLRIALETAIRL